MISVPCLFNKSPFFHTKQRGLDFFQYYLNPIIWEPNGFISLFLSSFFFRFFKNDQLNFCYVQVVPILKHAQESVTGRKFQHDNVASQFLGDNPSPTWCSSFYSTRRPNIHRKTLVFFTVFSHSVLSGTLNTCAFKTWLPISKL